jgi:predicted MFS family arabinose efflux permease
MPQPFWRRPVYILICGSAVIMVAIGIRQSFGLFLKPISVDMGWGFEIFSSAVAVQNLMIGIGAPLLGAIADRWGHVRVIALSGAVYAVGLFLISESTAQGGMVLSAGFLSGLGLAGVGLPLMLAVVGQVAPPEKRSVWLGIVTAGGTAGQMVVVPVSQGLIDLYGWYATILILSAAAAMIVPLVMSMSNAKSAASANLSQQTLAQALAEAVRHRGYILLVTGFFVCGLHVQFIATHLPNYLSDSGLGAGLAATAIAVIGLFNMIGTYTAGYLGGKLRKNYLLSAIYFARSVVILVFFQLPISEVSVMLFAAAIGLLWLSTVPLTGGIVAGVFGTRYMATLYGIVFLSHQLGSFTGVWLGAIIRDATGSYDIFWWVTVVFGLLAALIHWPIDVRPVARLAEEDG